MRAHAILSASTAHRWTQCPASVVHSTLPNPDGFAEPTNAAAEEGTKKHQELENCIDHGVNSRTPDVQVVLAGLQSIKDEAFKRGNPLIVWPEVSLRVGAITGELDARGTADILMVGGDELWIVDAKFGFSPVEAKGNAQLLLYAAAYLKNKKAKNINLVIAQPTKYPEWDQWGIGWDYLTAWTDKLINVTIKEIHAQFETGKLIYRPSEKACQWCPARATCLARSEFMGAKLGTEMSQKSLENLINKMLAESEKGVHDWGRVVEIYKSIKDIKNYLKSVESLVEQAFDNGKELKGLKKVPGGPGRLTWKEGADLDRFGEIAWEKKYLTPTQVKSSLTSREWEESFKELTYRPKGKSVIVNEDDTRISTQPRAEEL